MDELLLKSSFRRLRRRMLAIGSLSGFGWGATSALALLACGIWIDLIWELPSGVRVGVAVAALAAGCMLAAVAAASALRRSGDRALARRLDGTACTGGQILSGYDLLSGSAATAVQAPLTIGLARLAVERAARLAAEVPRASAVPIGPLRRACSWTAILVAAMGMVALSAPRMAATEWLRFSDPFGDHPPYSRTVLNVEPGNTAVHYGASLDVLVTTDGPVADAVELVMLPEGAAAEGDEQTLSMFPEAGGKWRAQIAELHAPVRYFARAHAARSHRYRLDVITVPRIERVTWRIAPPAYTRDAVYEGPLPPAGLAGLPGTRVRVVA